MVSSRAERPDNNAVLVDDRCSRWQLIVRHGRKRTPGSRTDGPATGSGLAILVRYVDGDVVVPSEPFADAPGRDSLGQPDHSVSPKPRAKVFAIVEGEDGDEEHATHGR